MGKGHHGIVPGHAEVPAIAHADEAQAGGAGFLDRQLHRPMSDDHPQAAVALDHGRSRSIFDDADLRSGIHDPVAQRFHVPATRIDSNDAVRIHAAQIRRYQDAGNHLGVFRRNAESLKNPDHEAAKSIGVDPSHLFVRHGLHVCHSLTSRINRVYRASGSFQRKAFRRHLDHLRADRQRGGGPGRRSIEHVDGPLGPGDDEIIR